MHKNYILVANRFKRYGGSEVMAGQGGRGTLRNNIGRTRIA